MKEFMEGVMEWKTVAVYFFTGSIFICGLVFYLMGESGIPFSVLLSVLIISLLGTFIQFLAFSDRIIKKMRYTFRLILFVVPFFALLAINAYIFRWFPVESVHWSLFTLIFIVVFLGMTVGFEVYFKVTGKMYDGLLGQYRQKMEAQENQPEK